MADPRLVVVPQPIVDVLTSLNDALGSPVMLAGLAAQARVAGGDPYPEGNVAVRELVRLLRIP